ncbi:SGNH/GDSL hydrolase family protein [Alteromonas facilis]|uniref:SGNH/GDSL hydrolase family protein n=1 Tax=Alteromonas facilis TaxID=2048004 RepID=UPI000C28B359|nr:hypothetical protein [Alteromonas facilis]
MKQRSKKNQVLFTLIGLSIPLLFFGLIEGSLRLVGVGQPAPLFIDNPVHPDYQLPRPDILTRYFPPSAQAPNVTLEANFLLKDKPDNGFRVFVQGGSTAAGYPYGMGASLAGMLDHRLKASLPGRYVEVVNTALSAVNSFTLLDIADEIIEQAPDAVVIYAGHNEFLGILGVGSNYTLGSHYALTRSMLWLKDFNTYQLLQRAIYSGFEQTNDTPSSQRRTVMSQVAKHKDIALDSEIFSQGIVQFERNMSALLNKYQAAGIPVFISTIASNLRDQPPFSSEPIPQAFTQAIKTVSSLSETKTLATQWKTSDSAALHFQIAQKLYQYQSFEDAKYHFIKAKELDLLRFRAPEAINQVIKRLAKNKGVYLVDAEQQMLARSEGNIVGNNLMLEHLHPNVPGYFIIADSVYQGLMQSGLFRPWQNISTNTAWKRRPLLPAEEYFGYASVLTLMADYPFTDSPQPVSLPAPADWQQELGLLQFKKQIDWLTMTKRSAERYQLARDTHMHVKALQLIADALPHDPIANVAAGEALFKAKRREESMFYLLRAQRAGDVTPSTKQLLRQLRSQ